MKKFIPIILLIVGIFIILIPALNNIYINKNTKYTLENSYENLKNKSNTNIAINTDSNFENSDNTLETVDNANIVLTLETMFSKNKNSDDIIGILYIPDINTKLPIFNNPTNENLMLGTTIVNSNQRMGELNYPLIGHYSKNKSVLFGALMDINIGSEILVSDGFYLYKYVTTNTYIVDDTKTDMIDINKYSNPTISLMTCYYSSNTGKRFFAIGELVEVSELNDIMFNEIFNSI